MSGTTVSLPSGTQVRLPEPDERSQVARMTGSDVTPVILSISLASGDTIEIDLDESGWMRTYADYLRVRSIWTLRWKNGGLQPLILLVDDGDQGFYVARHIGLIGSGGSGETIAYGIGKRRPPVIVERTYQTPKGMKRAPFVEVAEKITTIWCFPNGVVCGGDDVERIGEIIVRAAGPR